MLLQIHYELPDTVSYFMQFVALALFLFFFPLTFHFILYFHNHSPSYNFKPFLSVIALYVAVLEVWGFFKFC